jgi:DMSO/TMAO reductase YedYZ molybdopterin-dependent catalytic subunit
MILSRRALTLGGIGLGGGLLAGCKPFPLPIDGSILQAGDSFTYKAFRTLLPSQTLVREFDREDISKNFPAINTIRPEPESYHRSRAIDFADYRLPVTGLVERPTAFSLADLKRFPARTQVTLHSCIDGWTAIGEWTGVQISRVLAHVGMKPEAKFMLVRTIDDWWGTYDLVDMLHPQSLITYGMNGGPLPMPHGAPIRLRIERQLGYKSLKFVKSIELLDRIDNISGAEGKGSSSEFAGYNWYSGI